MKKKGGGPGVWPGYVAAVVCLLQGLILLIGIIALVIAVIAMAPRLKEHEGEEGDGDFSISVEATENYVDLHEIGDVAKVNKLLELNNLKFERVDRCILLAQPFSSMSLDLKKSYIRNIYVKNRLVSLGVDAKKITMKLDPQSSSKILKVDCYYRK